MKKFFNLHCKEEENALKEKMIELSNIPLKYVNFLEMYVSDDEFMHVTIIDDLTISNKKDIVLIHGLAASSLQYFKLFKRLSQNFRIFAIDLPGMGLSSRHKFKNQDFNEIEDYFLNRLRKCFDDLNLKNFYIIAHSFGAYISSLFTLRYQEYVIQLILLSPVGLSANYAEIKSTRLEDFLQVVCFKVQKTPNGLFKGIFGFSSLLFNYVCDQSKFRGLKDKYEFDTHRDFLNVVLRNSSGSENAIFSFFNKNLQAYKPLTYYYECLLNVNIYILYGGDDWCPMSHAEDLKRLLPNNVKIDVISDSGHFLFTDNYLELLDKLFDNFKNFDKNVVNKFVNDHGVEVIVNSFESSSKNVNDKEKEI